MKADYRIWWLLIAVTVWIMVTATYQEFGTNKQPVWHLIYFANESILKINLYCVSLLLIIKRFNHFITGIVLILLVLYEFITIVINIFLYLDCRDSLEQYNDGIERIHLYLFKTLIVLCIIELIKIIYKYVSSKLFKSSNRGN